MLPQENILITIPSINNKNENAVDIEALLEDKLNYL
jgi:hypothetical protein